MRIILFAFLQVVGSEFFIDDSILYKVDFPGLEDTSSFGSENEGEMESYTLVSKNKEKYECFIPKVSEDEDDQISKYSGESPVQLIESLFKEEQCVHRLESYWTYELCHGKHLRQYHEERAGKDLKMQEYILGRYSTEKLAQLIKEEEADKENDITRHPPTKKVQSLSMPYYEINMGDGTLCDLNSEPRRVKILYMCYPTGRNEILSVKETSTCEYEVIVLTSVLCTHPHFKPEEVSEHGIKCRPLLNSPAKPADLVALESESNHLRGGRYWEAHFKTGSKPGQVKIEIRPSEAMEKEENKNTFEVTKPKAETWKEPNRQPFKPIMDAQIVKQFLRGEHCLVGGSGWWKYQFCYGKKVDQFHVEQSGEKTVISLGIFDENKHLKWIEEHPTKKPKPMDKRKFVSHLYSDGSICDLTGRPRQVEVKLKCKEADSPSVVSLYLLEPKTCQYVLGVESPLVCDILPHADPNTGLIPLGLLDSLDKPVAAPTLDLSLTADKSEKVNPATFLTEIEEAVRKIKDFKGRTIWEKAPDDLSDLEEEGVLTKQEKERLAVLKDRIKRRKEKFGSGDSEHVVIDSLQDKTFYYSSSSRQETSGGTMKEDVFIVDGVKIKLQEVLVDGKIVSTRVIRERESGNTADNASDTDNTATSNANKEDKNDNAIPNQEQKQKAKDEALEKDEL